MIRRMAYSFLFALIILFGSAPFDPASATLVFDSQIDITGTGLGAVNTVLTIQKQGSASTDKGCVGRSPVSPALLGCPGATPNSTPSDTGRFIGGSLGGDEQTGDAQTKTIPVGSLTGTTLRVVFNPSEPNSNTNNLNLNTLVLSLYNGTTNAFKISFSCNITSCPHTFAAVDLGTGHSGFVFKLDATEAALFNANALPTDRIGLSASTSGVQGGHETFFVASVTAVVPEPTSLLLLGSGLAGLGLWKRARRKGTQV